MISTKTRPMIHLFIPHLLQPLVDWQKDFLFEVESPNLSALLSHFQINKKQSYSGLNQSLFTSIGLSEHSQLPIAHYRHQLHFESQRNGQLICADPIHLEVGLNDITLTEKIDDLTDAEAVELIELLNQHFKEDDIEFIIGSNNQFYLALPQQEELITIPLENALRQNIAQTKQASGERNWQVIQNEIQMLLHSSEVNQQREMAGQTSVNSLWLWGAGKALAGSILNNNIKWVVGGNNDKGIQGKTLAKATDCKWIPLPDSIETLLSEHLEELAGGEVFVILDQLFMPAIESKPEVFQQTLLDMDEVVIKPLINMWNNKKIELIIDSCDGVQYQPKHVSPWKFWSKPTSLVSLVQKGHK